MSSPPPTTNVIPVSRPAERSRRRSKEGIDAETPPPSRALHTTVAVHREFPLRTQRTAAGTLRVHGRVAPTSFTVAVGDAAPPLHGHARGATSAPTCPPATSA